MYRGFKNVYTNTHTNKFTRKFYKLECCSRANGDQNKDIAEFAQPARSTSMQLSLHNPNKILIHTQTYVYIF